MIEDGGQQTLLAAKMLDQLRFAGALASDSDCAGVLVTVAGEQPLAGEQDAIMEEAGGSELTAWASIVVSGIVKSVDSNPTIEAKLRND